MKGHSQGHMVEIHSGPVAFSPPVSLAPFSLQGMGKVCLGGGGSPFTRSGLQAASRCLLLPFWRLPTPESQDGNLG